jgi:hypothetical protein
LRKSGQRGRAGLAVRHRGVVDGPRPPARRGAVPEADQSGRREHDEGDEEQPEHEQPVLGHARQVVTEDDEEQRPERRPEERAHAADDHHRQQLAGERDRDRLGRGHPVVEQQQHAGERGDGRGYHERDELVALRVVAEEARALFVLADRHQHAAERRAVEAPERQDDERADRGDERVVAPGRVERHAGEGRAHDAAQPVLAAGHLGPAEGDREEHRRQREREQREIDAAPTQDEDAEHRRGRDHDDEPERERQQEAARKELALRDGRRVSAEPEPRAVPERREAGVPDEHVERHAGEREDDDLGRRGHAEPDGGERERQRDERDRGDDQVPALGHRGYSKRWMRSPNSPRGRTSRTSNIRR